MVKKKKIKVYFLTSILIMTIISTILIVGVKSSQKWYQPIFEGIHNIINSYDFSTKPSFPFDFLSGSTPYSTKKIYIEDDKIEFRYSIIVNDSISKVIENISSMIDDINDFTLDYKSYKIPIYIYLDFYSDDGYLAVESKKLTFIDKEIFLQIDDSVDINIIFDHLKDFHYISIGGYRSYKLNIPYNFNYNVFKDYTELRYINLFSFDEIGKLKEVFNELNINSNIESNID